ncbi:MAG: HAD-IC family P-type ATPase [Bacilli bacterium]|nr:HAD-IC family P-type ATPase [Bacilli bacterium]
MKENRYYAMNQDEVFKRFQVDENGLSTREATKRLNKYGKNELPKKEKDSIIKIFLLELLDPIVLLLMVAIIASFIVGEVVDACAIIFIVLVDLIIGTYEENKANTTVEALASLVPEKVKVDRDGREVLIDAKDLTVGDYVYLESGDKISADLRLVEAHNFTVDESILTGESITIEKNAKMLPNKELAITSQSNMVFAGTSVVTGRARAIVIGVGLNTEIGKIANTLNETVEEKSPLTIRVDKFSKQISILIGVLSVFLALLLFSKGLPFQEVLVSVIALAVSAMPEGLPLALTMALTIASNKMAKRKVVAKKLNYVESLGSCTVIASDKTGTLTVNEQTAKKIVLPNDLEYAVSGSGYSVDGSVVGEKLNYAKEIAKLGVINNEAKFSKSEQIGDSIDIAFLVLGEKMKTKTNDIEILETIPYESANKYSAVFYKKDGETYCTIKGSLEVVMSFCNKINLKKDFSPNKIEEQNESLSSDGYRVIAIANGKIKEKDDYSEKDIKDITFMGLVGFIDPIRKEAVNAIKKCTSAGIKVLMITGDHPLTAFKIAKDLKLTKDFEEVTTGSEVEEYLKKSEKEFDEFVKSKKIFTRVTPIEKLKIVESLKRQEEFVAVTGDGVNDAPALKVANIGIAMGSGTDIAKETAKMIVIDDNFKSIVNGVLEGRVAYANIRKITYFLISCGLAEVLFFAFSIFFDMPMPLVAIQLLWLNVVTDGIQDIALSFEKAEPDIMNKKPRDPKESLFDNVLLDEILLSGICISVIVFGLWYYLLNVVHMEISIARGYTMALMIILQNIHAFNCRSEDKSSFKIPLSSNPIFLVGVLGSMILGVAVLEVPFLTVFLKTAHVPGLHLVYLILFGFTILVIMELYKWLKYSRKK